MPLDVLVLILAAVAFAAGVITYCYEVPQLEIKRDFHRDDAQKLSAKVHSAPEEVPGSPNDIEDASPVSVKSSPPEKAEDTEQDRRHKASNMFSFTCLHHAVGRLQAREDLPEPEPEGCDEDSRRKGLEARSVYEHSGWRVGFGSSSCERSALSGFQERESEWPQFYNG